MLPQVRNCTGFSGTVRTADALIISLWPSRGLELIGVEIKVARQDWLREKENPEKADEIGKYCDRWWIVTPPGIVHVDELPAAWGLMEWHEDKKKWKTVKPAQSTTVKPVTKEFLAAILRRASETSVPHGAIDERIKQGIEKENMNLVRQLEGAREDARILKQRILDFEKASGVKLGINSWTYPEPEAMGVAVRQVMNGAHTRIAERLEQLKKTAENIVADVTQHLSKSKADT